MDLDLFDNIDGLILHERESSLLSQNDNRQRPQASPFPENAPLGMAYVPMQQWGDTCSPEEALENGSLFPELIFPFMRGGGSK
ncbi:MAG: spore coat associated protein CotJA [Ruminococcus sp.]|nr:spore coat associated protein CotJA [Ruminococcus sp.]